MTKECEDSDGATEALMEGTSIEFSDSPSFLDKYLLMVSKTGNPLVQWSKISFFIRHKIDAVSKLHSAATKKKKKTFP